MSSSDQLARNIDSGQFATTKKGEHDGLPAWVNTCKGHKKSAMESVSATSNGERTINSSQEESYQLLAPPEGSIPPFAMRVCLTPEIVEELKRAEAEGVTPRMKFGDNVGGHVIAVGLETFKFSSVPEPIDVCYIYAEQADENGKHILREVGSAWRQLSVQRILSTSEKEQRTAEAENKQKLLKSILVDQNKQMSTPQALAEVDNTKAVLGMGKEPPPKKRKVTNCPLSSGHEQLYSTDQIGNQYISAPASLSPDLVSAVVKEAPVTPLMALPCWKGKPANGGEAFQLISKARSTEKEKALITTMSAGSNINVTDIRNLLIGLLQETPKGMTIKALEKAVTEKLAVNPERKWIEKTIKSIATFHAPGKYILNPGVEKETFVDASIGSSGKSNATSCVETIETKAFTDSILETNSQKEPNLDLPKASHNKSHDSPANEHFSPQPVYSHATNEFAGKSPRNGAMDAEAIASRGSGSSSTNESESESESGTGSATSASDSSSGSESDVSTSNGEPSMDEDVDIMSDGEDEMRSDLSHQKFKGEDLKLLVKEVSKLQDDFENTEEIDSKPLEKHNASLTIQSKFPGKIWPTSENTKVKERECKADSLLETVFRPEKDADVTLDSHVLLKDDNLKKSLNSSTLRNEAACGVALLTQMPLNKQIDTFSETSENCQEQGHGNQEQRKRTGSDRSTSLGQMEARAEKRAKQLDILVDKICEDKDAVSTSSWCVKSGAHQTNYQSPSCKVSEMVEKKEPEQHSIKQETRLPIEKANGNSNPKGDNLSKNNSLSLEASTEIVVGSSLKAKDRLQKIGRPSKEANNVNKMQGKQHSSIKPDKLTTTNQRRKHGEVDKREARSSECNERIAPKIASISSRLGENRKFARSLHNVSKEVPGKDDRSRSKEEVGKSNMHKLTNSEETLPRWGKSLKAQQCPSKDAGTNKSIAPSFTSELGNVHDALELGRIKKDTQKASEHNSLEWAERISSFEEQVERPKKDADLSKQDGEFKIEDDLKETGLTARPSNKDGMGRTTETANIDSGHSSRSGHAFSRSSFHESKRFDSQDLELGEFREPLSENEVGESKRPSSRREKHCFEATSRVTANLKSVSPGSKKPLLLSRSRVDVSPAQGENNFLQELHSQEMITQDAQRAAPYRPLKKNQGAGQSKQKLEADRVKQSQRGGSVSTSKDLGGSTRSGGSDLQNHTAGSKETIRKHSNKLLGDSNASAFSQQKASNAKCFPKKEKVHRAKDSQMSCKRQTPQSSEVHGGDFFVLYEKEEPELRGAIYSLEQFRDYYQEFNEKYHIYMQLNTSLENDKENFEMFRKDFEDAELRGDMTKLAIIHGMIRKEYFQCRKRSKRMRHTFKVLHEELQAIKQQCKDYVQKSRRR